MDEKSGVGVGILLRAHYFYRYLASNKKILLIVLFLGLAATTTFTFTAKRFYTATTVIMPPVQQGSGLAALAQLGAAAGFSSGALGGGKTPDELYGALIKSRSVMDAIIERFSLRTVYKQNKATDLRDTLLGRINVNIDKKSGLITVSVDDYDAKRSSEMANALISELRVLLSRVAITEAQQKTRYFENQVLLAQKELADLESTFSNQSKLSGSRVLEFNAELAMKAAADIRRQIAELKIRRAVLTRVRSAESDELIQLNTQMNALERSLKETEQGIGWTDANEAGTETANSYKKIKIKAMALEVLMRQLEAARIEEAKEAPLVQQIDVAQVPEYPSKPRRLWLLMTGILASCFAAIAAVWLKLAWIGFRNDHSKI